MKKHSWICSILLMLGLLEVIACNKTVGILPTIPPTNTIVVTGIIERIGVTPWMYGSHKIIEDSVLYVLISTISLDSYLNQYVTIVGEKVDAYPCCGGPEFLEVIDIK